MAPLFSLISLMIVTIIFGKASWTGKTVKYAVVVAIALIQTALVLIGMFIVKAPAHRLPY